MIAVEAAEVIAQGAAKLIALGAAELIAPNWSNPSTLGRRGRPN